MNDLILSVVLALVGLCVGAIGTLFYKKSQDEKTKKGAAEEAEKIVSKARSEAQRIDRESKQRAKDFEARAKSNTDKEIQKQRQKLTQEEKALVDKESKLDR